ncbi:MAG TPA: hypothetical protein VK588_08240, partial [Chitinophagaceae bacterium]|nr:hypothetical protein [Chitinophagaceae bacterium]
MGFGGSFFNIGLIEGFIETKDFAAISCFFKGAGSLTTGLTGGLTSGFFGTDFNTGFFTAIFLATGFFTVAFLATGLAGFPAAGR